MNRRRRRPGERRPQTKLPGMEVAVEARERGGRGKDPLRRHGRRVLAKRLWPSLSTMRAGQSVVSGASRAETKPGRSDATLASSASTTGSRAKRSPRRLKLDWRLQATGGSFSHYVATFYSASFTLTGNDGKRVGSITRKFMKDAGKRQGRLPSYFELRRILDSRAAAPRRTSSERASRCTRRSELKGDHSHRWSGKGRYVWASYGFEAPKREVDRFRYLFKEHIAAAGRKILPSRRNGYVLPQRTRDILKESRRNQRYTHLADFEHGGEARQNWLLNVGDGVPMWHGKVTIDPAPGA